MTKDRREISDKLDARKRKHEENVRSLTRMQEERRKLMEEYAEAQARQWNEGAEICPTCNQPLPPAQVEELRAAFNEMKSKQKEDINRRGQECSKDKIDALAAEIDAQAADITAMENTVREMERIIAERKANLTTPPPFEETAAYKDINARMEELRDRHRIHESAADGVMNGYDRDIAAVREEIAALHLRIAKAKASEDSRRRVGELRQELKDTAEEVEYLEQGIHLCEEFIRTKARMVTESINSRFQSIRFILFREQINGGLKEICEPVIANKAGEWVEYRSVNYAAQVNANLDIVSTLMRHYGVHLPVLMDQGESVTEPLAVDGQFIRFIVSPKHNEVKVELREKY